LLASFFLAAVAIFVAMDIVGAVPMYVRVTEGLTEIERRKVVNVSMLVAFGVALIFLFSGEVVFRVLGITLSDFKVAGGLVLLLISLSDLIGYQEVKSRVSGETGIVPLAVPVITGPAVLTTIVLQASHIGYLPTIAALITNYAFAWILLFRSPGVNRLIGKDGTVVLSKIAALLLAAYAVSMIRSGVFEAIGEAIGNFRS
jgi:multiple antibiotic resistance protein